MKSLQIVTPKKECCYNCPFCIAKSHIHDNNFINNYEKNYDLWKERLTKVISDNQDLQYAVITGVNEPMQTPKCVLDIIKIIRSMKRNIQIEIQTRMYKKNDIYNLVDVTCYSISDFNLIKKIEPIGKRIRYVFILTDSFNNKSLSDIIYLLPSNVSELTFKVLQDSNGINKKLDNWIKLHKINDNTLENLNKEISNYQGNLSIYMDNNCMDSVNRYAIFREDGKVYSNWDKSDVLGIYMGSFNPPHKGHLNIVNYLLEKDYVDKILLVPTLGYWDKNNLADIKDRIKMLKYFENDKIMVDTIHNKYIYTYELLKELELIYPNKELSIIMGADNLITLNSWKNYQELLKYHIIVMNRHNINVRDYLKNISGNFTILDDYPYLNISSTKIRNNLTSEYLDSKVLKYIKKNNLYR